MSQVKFFKGSSTLSSITSPQDGGFYVSTAGGIGVTDGSTVKQVASMVSYENSNSMSSYGAAPKIGTITIDGINTDLYFPYDGYLYVKGLTEVSVSSILPTDSHFKYVVLISWTKQSGTTTVDTYYACSTFHSAQVISGSGSTCSVGTPVYLPTSTSATSNTLMVPMFNNKTKTLSWVNPVTLNSQTISSGCTVKVYQLLAKAGYSTY